MNDYREFLKIFSEENYKEFLEANQSTERKKDSVAASIENINILKTYEQKMKYKWGIALILVIVFFMLTACYFLLSNLYIKDTTQRLPLSETNVDKLMGYWGSDNVYLYLQDGIFHYIDELNNINQIGELTVDTENQEFTLNFPDFAPQTFDYVQIANNGTLLTAHWGKDGDFESYVFQGLYGDFFQKAKDHVNDNLTEPLFTNSFKTDSPLLESSFGPGNYQAGIDIPAGEYNLKTTGIKGLATIYSNNTYDSESIVGSVTFVNNSYIRVENGEFLELEENTYAIPVENSVPVTDSLLSYGIYKVGYDLPAGTYEVLSNGGGVWEINSLSPGHQWSKNEIGIEEVHADSPSYVTVSDGQYLTLYGSATILLER